MVPWTERITVFGQCSTFKPFHVLSHDRDMKRFEGWVAYVTRSHSNIAKNIAFICPTGDWSIWVWQKWETKADWPNTINSQTRWQWFKIQHYRESAQQTWNLWLSKCREGDAERMQFACWWSWLGACIHIEEKIQCMKKMCGQVDSVSWSIEHRWGKRFFSQNKDKNQVEIQEDDKSSFVTFSSTCLYPLFQGGWRREG